jgi:membrane associated rhomboid family serine protease
MFALVPVELKQSTAARAIPTANAVLVAANVVVFVLAWSGPWAVGPGTGMLSIVTYGFSHFSFWHLVANMWVLLVFGKPVNRRIGNTCYLLSYLGTLLTLGALGKVFLYNSHLAGASGAIFAVIVMALMLVPAARLRVYYVAAMPLTLLIGLFRRPEHWLYWFLRWGEFSLRAVWCLALIPVMQLCLFCYYGWSLTYLAHLLGMVCGMAAVLLLPQRISMGTRRAAFPF